mmetsp:Transcript_43384/g.114280  ORF Transcript_43384/g.114280 Transcript_43384/m.114280 type:complete len:207 (+) Transcript_43384:1660-2280(+)
MSVSALMFHSRPIGKEWLARRGLAEGLNCGPRGRFHLGPRKDRHPHDLALSVQERDSRFRCLQQSECFTTSDNYPLKTFRLSRRRCCRCIVRCLSCFALLGDFSRIDYFLLHLARGRCCCSTRRLGAKRRRFKGLLCSFNFMFVERGLLRAPSSKSCVKHLFICVVVLDLLDQTLKKGDHTGDPVGRLRSRTNRQACDGRIHGTLH